MPASHIVGGIAHRTGAFDLQIMPEKHDVGVIWNESESWSPAETEGAGIRQQGQDVGRRPVAPDLVFTNYA